jgi:hypothetical protein
MAVQAFDRSVLKVGQVFIIGLNVVAFALGFVLDIKLAWLLVPVVCVVMLAGVVNPNLNLFRQFYLRVLKPAGIVKPNVAQEDPTPHQFAQAVGATFLAAASLTFLLGAYGAGWVLSWIVIVLAFVNFAFDFCVGCQVYLQLDRMHMLPRRG